VKKYELTDETLNIGNKILHRIKALTDFSNIEAGDLGGFVESESNLDHSGNCWISGSAQISSQSHWMCVGLIGSRDGFTTFFRTKDENIGVSCGCFNGSLPEFLAKVEKTHGDSKHAKAYRKVAEMAELLIDCSPLDENTEAKNAN
jgi:hypothetical protein